MLRKLGIKYIFIEAVDQKAMRFIVLYIDKVLSSLLYMYLPI